MDVFLSEGMEVIFKIALALLTIGKETVLSLDMEAMLKVSLPYRASIALSTDSDKRDFFLFFSTSKKNCRGKSKATSKDSLILHIPSKLIRRK